MGNPVFFPIKAISNSTKKINRSVIMCTRSKYIQKMIFKVIFFILAYSATNVISLEVQCTLYKLNYPANLTNDGTIKFGVYGKNFINFIIYNNQCLLK